MTDPRSPVPALVVVDMQFDFADPAGSLFVQGAPDILPGVAAEIEKATAAGVLVVYTQDWHPPGHVSFATSHGGRKPMDQLRLDDGREQVLWPEHCLQGSRGAARRPC